MSATELKPFQEAMRDGLVGHFANLRAQYVAAAGNRDIERALRCADSALMLQAPTGVGKTLIAVETVQRFSPQEKMIWFWFVPFTGLIAQARQTFQAQAPEVPLLDISTDRTVESLRPGAVYVLSWQSVSVRRAETRLARETRDEGLSVDDLIERARELGYRMGCVVDEAHHGFHRPGESTRFFKEVLQPDYTLMMTATPRDEDAIRFSQSTGYEVGPPERWPTITRDEGVKAGLLKADVKTVRFIAKHGMEELIVDFERLALSQCWEMHQVIRNTLEEMGVGITPLMLVQVPNGDVAAAEAERALITLGVPAATIRKHTADEPDPALAAIANDSNVEVLIFKMAIAMGFDAPRAFTLAALRGVRDQNFGIQVVGRIMRVHRLLQGRDNVPALLNSGYVFLANQEDQEGLRTAADLINELAARQPTVGAQTVITVTVGDSSSMQIVGTGQTLELPLIAAEPSAQAGTAPTAQPGEASGTDMSAGEQDEHLEEEQLAQAAKAAADWILATQATIDLPTPAGLAGQQPGSAAVSPSGPSIAAALAAASARTKTVQRKSGAPATLKAEVMPPLPDNVEEQIVGLVDFTPVLGDRDRRQTRVTRRTEGLFADDAPVDEAVLARMSPAVLAERAKQIALEFEDLDQRSFLRLLEERFRQALTGRGIEAPAEIEVLREQLDLVLVRNPRLIREAQRRVRASLIQVQDVALPDSLTVPVAVSKAARNIYGVFPPDMTIDEREFAEILDTDPDVVWWHRNPAAQPSSVVLHAWSGGLHAFFPDFVVAVEGRTHSDGVALAEAKGPHLLEWEKAKAGARHQYYGRVFMVGKQTRAGEFMFWRLDNNELALDGVFEVQRMKQDI
jgi:hypothetical protein